MRCFNSGYDRDHPVDILGEETALSRIVTQCDHLINVPVLKAHGIAGVTLSMKNHLGSVDNPWWFHTHFAERCAALNAQGAIQGKTRLIVTDALFGSSTTRWVPDFAPNSLIVSADPVVTDYVGTEMINEERAKHNETPTRPVPLLEEAVRMGLGAPAEEIRRVFIYMGTQVGVLCALSAGTVPGPIVADRSKPLEVRVVLDASMERSGSPRRMTVDASSLGFASELPLHHTGGGRYTVGLTAPWLSIGQYPLPVMLEAGEDEWIQVLVTTLDVVPEGDRSIYEEGPRAGWTVRTARGPESDPTSSNFVRSGSFSHAILLMSGSVPGNIKYVLDDSAGIDPFGYTDLEFYVNGGEASGQNPSIAGQYLSNLGIVPRADTWTLVSIPISEVPLVWGRLTEIQISGRVTETFYLDDMKLVAKELRDPETAVETSERRNLPSGYALSQNLPNPFNARTTIPYTLPKAGSVQLTLYNTAGQRIRGLVHGHQQAGSYGAIWDGKNEAGRDAASGVYLVRLAVEGKTARTRRMTLVR